MSIAKQDIFQPGSVWLVGAGPGDPGLLTVLAAKAISQADVIVYDALVNDEILAGAHEGCELRYAGKRGGKPSPKQGDISLALVDLAQQGKRVLRLKGGDPFVFGRGGEEALTLVEHGIPFRIVPGISAGIGGLAYAGIPVTHRDINQSVTFLTGHDSSGLVPDAIDWAGVVSGAPVIVMYMAMKHWPNICNRLMENGLEGKTPVAFVCNATLDDQKVVETSLAKSMHDVEAAGLLPPAIVVVGEAVKLRKSLNWRDAFEGRPMSNAATNLSDVSKTG